MITDQEWEGLLEDAEAFKKRHEKAFRILSGREEQSVRGIKWLRPEQVKDLNERALYEGEPHEVIGDLEGPLNRPRGHYHFAGTTSPYDLAALYAVALVKAHAFQDGNKRTALLAIRVFLRANGLEFDYGPYDEEAAEIMTGIATGAVEWIRRNTEGTT